MRTIQRAVIWVALLWAGGIHFLWAFEPEIDSRVQIGEELKTRVMDHARQLHASAVHKIWIGQLGHPVDMWGARVEFMEPVDATRARRVVHTFEIPHEKETYRKPGEETVFFRVVFKEGPFSKPHSSGSDVRIFRMQHAVLYLALDPQTSYEAALEILQAVERNEFEKERTRLLLAAQDNVAQVPLHTVPNRDDVRCINLLRYDPANKNYTLHVRRRPFSADTFTLEKREGRWVCVGSGHMIF